jgi:hypothetical protein
MSFETPALRAPQDEGVESGAVKGANVVPQGTASSREEGWS